MLILDWLCPDTTSHCCLFPFVQFAQCRGKLQNRDVIIRSTLRQTYIRNISRLHHSPLEDYEHLVLRLCCDSLPAVCVRACVLLFLHVCACSSKRAYLPVIGTVMATWKLNKTVQTHINWHQTMQMFYLGLWWIPMRLGGKFPMTVLQGQKATLICALH